MLQVPGTVAAVTASNVAAATGVQHRAVVRRVLGWYGENARDLPWRRPEATPWQVMVSEFMLQQTPVERVRGPWQTWVERWPTPAALAAAPSGEAVRAWGRLGYPRRALRLHRAAVAITEDFGGEVPSDRETLLTLPGVGSYTAAPIASFAFGRREVVLDTNVRRVLARVEAGVAFPAAAQTVDEVDRATAFVPATPARAARWAVAVMELGALVCVARSPRCAACPVRDLCAWRGAGYPAWDGPPRRGQSYGGTDRQCRGALLAVLRSSDGPVARAELAGAWVDADQRERCLASLLQDGLAMTTENGDLALPH
jgi:A/G-specific adenine glycosylase